jgi:hypothetical protein
MSIKGVGVRSLQSWHVPLHIVADQLLHVSEVAISGREEFEFGRVQLEDSRRIDTIRDPLVVLENDMTIVTASKGVFDDIRDTEAETHGRRVSELGQHQWDAREISHRVSQEPVLSRYPSYPRRHRQRSAQFDCPPFPRSAPLLLVPPEGAERVAA